MALPVQTPHLLERETPDTLVTYYLHMTNRAQFRPAFLDKADLTVQQMHTPDLAFYKFLYCAVGDVWRWRDRLVMPENDLFAALNDPACSVHVLYASGVPAGYFELVNNGGDTELAYFGLRPQFLGCGYGKHLLSVAIARAWDDGARRVHVHTCNLDAPGALPNYQKRGFTIYDTAVQPMPQRYMH
jgi:GNAT superfamily N-acetyltransferase